MLGIVLFQEYKYNPICNQPIASVDIFVEISSVDLHVNRQPVNSKASM